MSGTVNLEVCAGSLASALAAQEGGAIRVELCDNLNEGGTTASAGQIRLARKLLHIKLYPLIRPREGDFLYSDIEFEIIKADIQFCINTGCDGVVIGMLHADGTIDKPRSAELAAMAKQGGLGVTFHRAFDMCTDLNQALEDVIEIGCERILTSGGKTTAMEGADVIAHLVEKAAGRILIMPGSGINETNASGLVQFTKATEIHSSARSFVKSKMLHRNELILLSSDRLEEDGIMATDVNKVREIIRMANY
jgi:copper homeostasis protein